MPTDAVLAGRADADAALDNKRDKELVEEVETPEAALGSEEEEEEQEEEEERDDVYCNNNNTQSVDEYVEDGDVDAPGPELVLVGNQMEYHATGVFHRRSSGGSSDSSDSDGIEVLTEAQQRELDMRDLADGILDVNPYVEPIGSDEDEEFYNFDDVVSSEEAGDEPGRLLEWENPSYLVKDLDTGESYRVEEIDQHYTLVTLDSVAAQHETEYVVACNDGHDEHG